MRYDYKGAIYGTWLVAGLSERKTKGGGAYFTVTCTACGFKTEKEGQQIKNRPPTCPECKKARKPDPRLPKAPALMRICITGPLIPILIENVDFHYWARNAPLSALDYYEKIKAKVFTGDTRNGLTEMYSPWVAAKACKAMDKDVPILPSFAVPVPSNPTPEGPHLKIRKEHQKFFNGEATTPPPSYIVAWAENTPNVTELEFRFMPGDEEYCYVLWSKIEVKQEAIPELVNNDHLPFGF